MKGIKTRWTYDMLFMLRKYFPCTDTNEVADMCGVSVRTVWRKAVELGLKKDPRWIEEKNRRGHFYARIANKGGNSGSFKKGTRSFPAGEFKKGQLPVKARKVIRLDTLEVYESGTALARALGRKQTAVSHAIKRCGKCAGVKVMFYDSYLRVRERQADRKAWVDINQGMDARLITPPQDGIAQPNQVRNHPLCMGRLQAERQDTQRPAMLCR